MCSGWAYNRGQLKYVSISIFTNWWCGIWQHSDKAHNSFIRCSLSHIWFLSTWIGIVQLLMDILLPCWKPCILVGRPNDHHWAQVCTKSTIDVCCSDTFLSTPISCRMEHAMNAKWLAKPNRVQVAIRLVHFGARVIVLFITKVKMIMLIKRSHGSSQSCSLLNLECLRKN